MSDRITDKMVRSLFVHFTHASGHRIARDYKDVGGWRLDYNGVYGGYVIEQIFNSSGAVSQPFGSSRRKAQEMWYSMHFAMRALENRKASRTRAIAADRRRRR